MKVAYYGNYCGPGWVGGKYIGEREATEDDFKKPPIDEFDAICKRHDYAIFKAHQLPETEKRLALKEADRTFSKEIKDAEIPGVLDNIADILVWAGGPGPKLRISDGTPDDITELQTRNSVAQELGQSLQNRMNEIDEEVENLNIALGLSSDWTIPQDTTTTDTSMLGKRQRENSIEISTDLAGNINNQQFYQDVEDVEVINSLLNMSDTTQDDTNTGEPQAKVARTESMTSIQKETPISKVLRIERNLFQETATVSLPVTFYLSLNRLNQALPVSLFVRMNHPMFILKDNTLVSQEVPTNPASFNGRKFGLSNDMATNEIHHGAYNGTLTASPFKGSWYNQYCLAPFPTTVQGNSGGNNNRGNANAYGSYGETGEKTIIPENLRYYAALYEWMTTLSTNYKITIVNASSDWKSEVIFVQSNDVYSLGQSRATGCFPADLALATAMAQPNVKKETVDPKNLNNSQTKEYTIMQGKWNPALFKKDVKNDGDNKTWTKTEPQTKSGESSTSYITVDASITEKNPYFYEGLGLHAYARDFSSDRQTCINLKVELEYICQFKDLRAPARYPRSADISATAPQILLSTKQIHQIPRPEGVERIGSVLAGGYTTFNPAP